MSDKFFRILMMVSGIVASIGCVLFINYLHNRPVPVVTEVTTKNFDQEIAQSKIPVVIEFYMDGCPNCEIQRPIVEKVALDYVGRVKFVRIDAPRNAAIARSVRLRDVPSTVFLDPATRKGRLHTGLMDETELRKAVEELLNPPADNGNGNGGTGKDDGKAKGTTPQPAPGPAPAPQPVPNPNTPSPPPAPMPPPVMPPADDDDAAV